ncbi:hypothetical protein VTK26DRAFT_2009 [Humicola hyalothermophila]
MRKKKEGWKTVKGERTARTAKSCQAPSLAEVGWNREFAFPPAARSPGSLRQRTKPLRRRTATTTALQSASQPRETLLCQPRLWWGRPVAALQPRWQEFIAWFAGWTESVASGVDPTPPWVFPRQPIQLELIIQSASPACGWVKLVPHLSALYCECTSYF